MSAPTLDFVQSEAPTVYRERGKVTPGTDEWRRLVSGSKIGSILGLDKDCSPLTQHYLMRGLLPPDEENDPMARGRIFESAILEYMFARKHPDWKRAGRELTVTRDDMPWAVANLDDQAYLPDGTTENIEAKSTKVDDGESWGIPGTDQIPEKYRAQVYWGQLISGVHRTRVWKHGPFVDQFDEYIVDFDPDAAAKMLSIAQKFHEDAFADEPIEPDVDGLISTYKTYTRVYADIERDQNWEISPALAIELTLARAAEKAAIERHNLAKVEVLRVMGKARLAVVTLPPAEGVKPKDRVITIARRQPAGKGVALYPPSKVVPITELMAMPVANHETEGATP